MTMSEELLEQIEKARTKHRRVHRFELAARGDLRSAEYRYQQATGGLDQAQSELDDMETRAHVAKREVLEHQRRVREKRQIGENFKQEEANVRRAQAEARRRSQFHKRSQDEVDRLDRELRDAERSVNDWQEDLKRREQEAHALVREINKLLDRREEAIAREQEEAARVIPPPPVTERATAALKLLLDSTEHDPGQWLRLNSDPVGNLSLAIDEPREGDFVVNHEDDPVLLVDTPLAEGLIGAVLDVDVTADGFDLILSR